MKEICCSCGLLKKCRSLLGRNAKENSSDNKKNRRKNRRRFQRWF
ncbi:hypothetical protein [Ruminococcus sp.]|nr:hypothetical protein [Ruminococcus sp.]